MIYSWCRTVIALVPKTLLVKVTILYICATTSEGVGVVTNSWCRTVITLVPKTLLVKVVEETAINPSPT